MEKEKPQMVLYGGLKMNKIRVIDLLNKIANGELAFEQEFKHNGFITDMEMFNNEYLLNEEVLNFEIELIEKTEEDKEIKELDYCEENTFSNIKEITYLTSEERRLLDSNFKSIKEKFDELIKAVNELKKGK